MVGLATSIGYLQQVSACDTDLVIILWFHFGDADPVGVDGNLVAKLIVALVLSVYNHINVLNPRRIAESQSATHLEGDVVTHQAFVAPVGNKGPFFRLGRALQWRVLEHVVRLSIVEFYTIGTLLEKLVSGTVSALTN